MLPWFGGFFTGGCLTPLPFFVLARALANKFRHVKDKMRRLNRVSYREDVAPCDIGAILEVAMVKA